MDPGYYTIIGILVFGVAYGLLKKKPRVAEKSNAGWAGLALIALLIGGLALAATLNSESWTWVFGLALMATLPILMLVAIGSSFGSFLKRRREPSGRSARSKADIAALICFVAALVFLAKFPWLSAFLASLGMVFWLKNKIAKRDTVTDKTGV